MKDNLVFNKDVREFYLISYGLEKTIALLRDKATPWIIEPAKPEFPFNDDEFVAHLDAMKEILADKFVTFCRKHVGRKSYIRRDIAASIREEFYRQEKKEYDRIKEYQSSRPDLYD